MEASGPSSEPEASNHLPIKHRRFPIKHGYFPIKPPGAAAAPFRRPRAAPLGQARLAPRLPPTRSPPHRHNPPLRHPRRRGGCSPRRARAAPLGTAQLAPRVRGATSAPPQPRFELCFREGHLHPGWARPALSLLLRSLPLCLPECSLHLCLHLSPRPSASASSRPLSQSKILHTGEALLVPALSLLALAHFISLSALSTSPTPFTSLHLSLASSSFAEEGIYTQARLSLLSLSPCSLHLFLHPLSPPQPLSRLVLSFRNEHYTQSTLSLHALQ